MTATSGKTVGVLGNVKSSMRESSSSETPTFFCKSSAEAVQYRPELLVEAWLLVNEKGRA